MKMRKFFFVLFFLSISMNVAFAQHPKKRNSKILVDANNPAVFISFLRLKEIKPDDETDDKQNLFFKITNNTRWNIWLQMSGVSKKDYGDASLYYAIVDEKGMVVSGSINCHVCSVNPVGAGESVVFSMPRREASYDTQMEIKYSFDWERNSESKADSYSEHIVGLAFDSLPKSVIPRPAPLPDWYNPTKSPLESKKTEIY